MTQHQPLVLVVDDEAHIRDMLQRNLESEGYRTLLASDGLEGLKQLEQNNPQIILLDLNMPNMNGVEFLSQIQPSVDRTKSVIVLSGYGTDREIKQCYQLGIRSFLRKPINWFELEGLIKSNLELMDYSASLIREIQERKRANQLLKTTFEGIAEGIIALDNHYHIRIISGKACQLVEISESEALGKPASMILGLNVAGPEGVLLRYQRHDQVIDAKVDIVTPAGRSIPVYLSVKSLPDGSSNLQFLLFFRTARKEDTMTNYSSGNAVFGKIVGCSLQMRKVYQLIENVANTNATILIQGESGTGKELVANEIHSGSGRSGYTMHTVNCAAIPEHLLESEFFGHEKGAFTSAHKQKRGRFEIADKSTLFLDEISEIPLEIQAKLLRVLQDQEFQRVGGTETITVDVRIIAATNKNLEELVRKKRFRKDLFYRLDVVKIDLPPLRERLTDIPLLVNTFMEQLNEKENRSVQNITARAMQQLLAYDWPGNVRELFHAIEYAFAFCKGNTLMKEHLPDKLLSLQYGADEQEKPKTEREAIALALEKSGFHKGKAAAMLGISYVTLYRKIKKYDIRI